MDFGHLLIFLGIYSFQFPTSFGYKIEKFRDTSGVYFQEKGPILFYNETYRVITFVDLRQIINFERRHRVYCNNYYPHCDNVAIYYKTYAQERDKALNMLGLSAQPSYDQGFIDSTFINSLFGSFNSQDAIFYNEYIIPNIKVKSVDQQTIIVNSTFGTAFPENLKNKTNRYLDSVKDNAELLEHFDLFNQWKMEMKILASAIIFSRLGKIHTEILSPDDLIEALKKGNKSYNNTFPYNLEIHNYDDIMHISDLRVSIVNEKLIFDLKVPMIKSSEFSKPETLFKLLPLPIKLTEQDLFFFTEPKADYITVHTNDSRHFLLYERDLQQCKENNDFILCLGHYPLIDLESKTCESSLITGRDIFSMCSIKIVKSRRTIWCEVEKNEWIFSTLEDWINVTCSGNTVSERITNFGWFELNEPCFAASHDVTLNPKVSFAKKSGLNFRVSEFDLSKEVESYLQGLNISLNQTIVNDVSDYFMEPRYLKLLGIPLEQLKLQAENLKHLADQKNVHNNYEEEQRLIFKNLEKLKEEIKDFAGMNQHMNETIKVQEEQFKVLREEESWTRAGMWLILFLICLTVVFHISRSSQGFRKLGDSFRRKRLLRLMKKDKFNSGNVEEIDPEEETEFHEHSLPSFV